MLASEQEALLDALKSCALPVDIVQVLYAGLRSAGPYDVVVLQVLEQDGWYRYIAVDHGVLQDANRRRLSDFPFASSFERPQANVVHTSAEVVTQPGRGPGGGKKPRTVIWVPILHGTRAIGAVLYQSDAWRLVEEREIAFLESVHEHLGEILVRTSLNELGHREQFSTADRATLVTSLTSCVTEADVVQVLYASLRPRLGYDVVSLHVLEREGWYHALAVDHGVLQ